MVNAEPLDYQETKSLNPAIAAPKWAKTGDRRLDISRLTESCALIYSWPQKRPTTKTAIPGSANTGTKTMTAANLIRRATVSSIWRQVESLISGFYRATYDVAEILAYRTIYGPNILSTSRDNASCRNCVQPSSRKRQP